MPSDPSARNPAAPLVTAAYRIETGLRDLLVRAARRRGWTPAVGVPVVRASDGGGLLTPLKAVLGGGTAAADLHGESSRARHD